MHYIPVATPPPPKTTAIFRDFKKSTAMCKVHNVGLRYIKYCCFNKVYDVKSGLDQKCASSFGSRFGWISFRDALNSSIHGRKHLTKRALKEAVTIKINFTFFRKSKTQHEDNIPEQGPAEAEEYNKPYEEEEYEGLPNIESPPHSSIALQTNIKNLRNHTG
jgi:hypothetical protein